jgi:hypothetical protein
VSHRSFIRSPHESTPRNGDDPSISECPTAHCPSRLPFPSTATGAL